MEMDINTWININLKVYIDGNCTFTSACKFITNHPDLRLLRYSDQLATFKLKTVVFETELTIENPHSHLNINPEKILNRVASVCNIHPEALKTKDRSRQYAEARMAYFLIGLHYRDIGVNSITLNNLGNLVNRDHCTVLYSKKLSHLPTIKNIIAKTQMLQNL